MKAVKLLIASCTLLTLGLAARPAHAQYYGQQPYQQPGSYPPPYYYPPPNPFIRPHFYLGIAGQAVAVLHETGPHSFLDHGGGFDLFLGFRTGRVFALELGWQPSFHNQEQDIFGRPIGHIALQALTLDFKFYPTRGRVQPYFVVGGGAYLLGDNFSVFSEGPGFQIGGGLDIWLTRFASIGIRLQYRGAALLDYDVYNENTYISMFVGGLDFTGRF